MDEKLQNIYNAILEGDKDTAEENIKSSLVAGFGAIQLLEEAMIPAMSEVGKRFEEGEYFVPEMLVAARAMQGGLNLIRPLLLKEGVGPVGSVVMGTVKGDLHDIGKNLVAILLEGAGFKIHDLGVDVPPEKFVQAVQELHPDIIGISAMLTTTMTGMKTVVDMLVSTGLRGQVKVIIGGAPLTESFAQQIGADGFAPNASRAPTLVRSLIGIKENV